MRYIRLLHCIDPEMDQHIEFYCIYCFIFSVEKLQILSLTRFYPLSHSHSCNREQA